MTIPVAACAATLALYGLVAVALAGAVRSGRRCRPVREAAAERDFIAFAEDQLAGIEVSGQ